MALARLVVAFWICGSCGFGEIAQLLVQAGVGVDARALDLAELAVDFRQRLFDRLHERVDGLLPLVEIALRALLELAELGGGELQERLARAVERLGGERFELVGQLGVRVGDERELVLGGFLLLLGARLQRRELFAGLAAFRPGDREPDRDAERQGGAGE